MKRLLIGSCVAALLVTAAPAMAEGYRDGGHPSGIQKQLDRGKAMPPGHQKKEFLKAHYRRDHHDRDRRYKDKHKRKYHKRDRDHYSRYDRGHHHRDRHRHSYRDHHRDRRHDRRHYHREYRVHIGFDDHVPPEYRMARIIHNTRELIEPSHR
ncbi:hypothetical protein QQF73_00430 [Marinobacter sp. M216]|uniref:Uncharacterized protein n=1 Tax=Marinobacter albus TaxID=3030833 RepID=A0ABT7H7R8_9GAMM|nr:MULTISPECIES: hypothetical protein [unclassified Marinobacter]MBW7471614.1 hypothetical protein [Marinobacter sp. F4218]MDK9556069.1 hypothetical protein [Marinobacter sp. M216]